jgi:hypothetical protein
MKAKSILSFILIAFVAVCIGYLILNESGVSSEDDEGELVDLATTEMQLPHQVVAYYFHGFKRCKTCLHIESAAKQAVEDAFPEELKEGRLEWKVVNFEEEENAVMAEKYQLVGSSLVISEMRDGQPVQWKTLEDVWELVWDEEPFAAYVRGEVEKYLASSGE